MDIAKVVGNNIKEARKLKGLTQSDVAKVFRMTQQQYSRFENGIFEITKHFQSMTFLLYKKTTINIYL